MIPIELGFGGPYDIVIIAAVAVLLFGGTKLAGLGKSMGQGIRDFKSAVREGDDKSLTSALPAAESKIE